MRKIWNAIWPLFIYAFAQNTVSMIGMMILGLEDQFYKYAVVFLIVAAIICIPIYYRMYRKDWETVAEEKRVLPMENKDYLAIIICGAALAVAMNNII